MSTLLKATSVCGCFSIAALFAASANGASPADPYGPRGTWTKLLSAKSVATALKLTPAQLAKIAELKPAQDDNRKAIAGLLTPAQLKSLRKFSWKVQGGYALFDAELSGQLELSTEQQARLKEASEVNVVEHKKMKDFLARARFRSREAMQKFINGYRDAAGKRLLDVLTAKQKKKLASILV